MTTVAPERSQTAQDATHARPCVACRVIQPPDALEPVPTSPGKVRCIDEAACRDRFRPRRLARSVRDGGGRHAA